jgi:hypothetical protein
MIRINEECGVSWSIAFKWDICEAHICGGGGHGRVIGAKIGAYGAEMKPWW